MGQNISGGSVSNKKGIEQIKEEKIKALVVSDVIIHTKEYDVSVPNYKLVDQIKYDTKIEETIKYEAKKEPTIEYIPKQEPTTKYIKRDEQTTKYIPVEVKCEKPVIEEKEYVVATVKDMDNVNKLMEILPTLMSVISVLLPKLKELKEYKLVEEVLKVPKIHYIPREEERIVWKDVDRERCKECGKGVD